jgi:molybdate transport system ATP-binding protein
MKIIVMAAGAAALVLTAGVADAAPRHRGHSAGGAALATPPQPIPYTQLDAYLAASPQKRASNDWWSGTAFAQTGTSANAAATTSTMGTPGATESPDAGAAPSSSATSPSASPGASPSTGDTGAAPPSGSVNPPADTGSSTAPPEGSSTTTPQ